MLAFSLGVLLGIVTSFGSICLTYILIKKTTKGVEFRPSVPDNKSMRAYTVGGKRTPKVRDDVEAHRIELKKAEEKELEYGG